MAPPKKWPTAGADGFKAKPPRLAVWVLCRLDLISVARRGSFSRGENSNADWSKGRANAKA